MSLISSFFSTSTAPSHKALSSRAPKAKKASEQRAMDSAQRKEYLQQREIAFNAFYRAWNDARDARLTHFPVNPTPLDCLMVLHGIRGRDDLVNCVSIRRLNDQEAYSPSHIPERRCTKARLPDLALGMISNGISTISHVNGVEALQNEERVYLTQSSFVRSRKGQGYTSSSRAYLQSSASVYVDVDLYNSSYKDTPLDDVISLIESRFLAHNIPLPVIICSGRGLYLKWFLSERLELTQTKLTAKENEVRWKFVQSRLLNLMLDFGADPKVRDLTRVLRLTGTRHENGIRVHVKRDDGQYHDLTQLEQAVKFLPDLEKNDLTAGFTRGDLYSSNAHDRLKKKKLSNALLDALSGTSRKRWRASDEKLLQFEHITLYYKEKFESKGKISEHSLAHRYFRVFLDLCSLAQLRGGIAAGMRDEYLLWIHTALFHAHLIRVEDVPLVSNQFALICQNEFNANDKGYLQALKERMKIDQSYRDASAKGYAIKKEVARRKRQAKTRTTTHCVPSGFQKKEIWRRSMPRVAPVHSNAALPLSDRFTGVGIQTYTPSCTTLVERLAITPKEQQYMLILTGETEKKVRRQVKENKTPARYERNRSIVHDYRVDQLSVRALAQKYDLSPASVYAILKQSNRWLEYNPLENRSIPVLTSGRVLPVHAPNIGSKSLWCASQGNVFPVGRFVSEFPRERLSSTTPALNLLYREFTPHFLSFISSSFSLVSIEGEGTRGSVHNKNNENSMYTSPSAVKKMGSISKFPIRSNYLLVWHEDLLLVNKELAKAFQSTYVPFRSACYTIPLRSSIEAEKAVKGFLGLDLRISDPSQCTFNLFNSIGKNEEINSISSPSSETRDTEAQAALTLTALKLQQLRIRCTGSGYKGPEYSINGFIGSQFSWGKRGGVNGLGNGLCALSVLGVGKGMRWLESKGAKLNGKPTAKERKVIKRVLDKVRKPLPATYLIAWEMRRLRETQVYNHLSGCKDLAHRIRSAADRLKQRKNILLTLDSSVKKDANQLIRAGEGDPLNFLESLVDF